MWFKNMKLYRLSPEFNVGQLSEQLERMAFRPIGSQESETHGWVNPFGDSGLVYSNNGQLLICLHTEKRLLPSTVVNQATKEKAAEIEEQQGYRPGRKQTKEIKEQVITELLPKSFVVASDTYAWIDPVNKWFAIDSASTAKCDTVIGVLSKCLDPFPVQPLHVEIAPAAAMTNWLINDEAPEGFAIDQDAELKGHSKSLATVRYIRQSIPPEEAQRHVQDGKQCTRLALTWNDKISFVLDDDLNIKKITPLDILKNQEALNEVELFDAEFALMTGEFNNLLADLVSALGAVKTNLY